MNYGLVVESQVRSLVFLGVLVLNMFVGLCCMELVMFAFLGWRSVSTRCALGVPFPWVCPFLGCALSLGVPFLGCALPLGVPFPWVCPSLLIVRKWCGKSQAALALATAAS